MSHSPPNKRTFFGAFTLVEVLVAMAILSFIVLILASVLGQSSRIWQQGVSDTQNRQRARAALEFISRDLKKATLPLDRTRQDSLRFEINPASTGTLPSSVTLSPDAIFWQAPIATESSKGMLAEVGYFVGWTGRIVGLTGSSKVALYRFFLNPSDGDYVASDPNTAYASVTNWSSFLFLENVVGMWITPYDKNGMPITPLPFDSRVSKALPATVEISLVMLDAVHAQRLDSLNSVPTHAATPSIFVSNLPAPMRSGATIVSMKVNLGNMTGW